jgi:hypothetical protein
MVNRLYVATTALSIFFVFGRASVLPRLRKRRLFVSEIAAAPQNQKNKHAPASDGISEKPDAAHSIIIPRESLFRKGKGNLPGAVLRDGNLSGAVNRLYPSASAWADALNPLVFKPASIFDNASVQKYAIL